MNEYKVTRSNGITFVYASRYELSGTIAVFYRDDVPVLKLDKVSEVELKSPLNVEGGTNAESIDEICKSS